MELQDYETGIFTPRLISEKGEKAKTLGYTRVGATVTIHPATGIALVGLVVGSDFKQDDFIIEHGETIDITSLPFKNYSELEYDYDKSEATYKYSEGEG